MIVISKLIQNWYLYLIDFDQNIRISSSFYLDTKKICHNESVATILKINITQILYTQSKSCERIFIKSRTSINFVTNFKVEVHNIKNYIHLILEWQADYRKILHIWITRHYISRSMLCDKLLAAPFTNVDRPKHHLIVLPPLDKICAVLWMWLIHSVYLKCNKFHRLDCGLLGDGLYGNWLKINRYVMTMLMVALDLTKRSRIKMRRF